MKRLIILFFFSGIPGLVAGTAKDQPESISSSAQEEMITNSRDDDMTTLAGNHDHSGGYGALFFKGTSFSHQALLIGGVRGAWVVNRSFGIGIDLNGIIPTANYPDIDPAGIDQAILVGGYGGLLLEPVLWSNKIVHLTFPLSTGAGWLGYVEDWENERYYYDGDIFDDDVFWYFEPGINLEVNVARFFRVGVGVSKRFTQDLQLVNTSTRAFDEMNYGFVLKFGCF